MESDVIFYQKVLKYFNDLLRLKSLGFMTKVKPINGNETKSDFFRWDIFRSDTISFFIKNY